MHLSTQFSLRRSKGFTLIELMVGIGLSAIVLMGILSVYIPAVKSWGTSADLAELHDTQAILHDTLGTNIRQAGTLGCNDNQDRSNVLDGVTPVRGIRGNEVENWAFGQDTTVPARVSPSFRAYAANNAAGIVAILSQSLHNERINIAGLKDPGQRVGDVFYTLSPGQGFYRVISSFELGPGPNPGSTIKTLTLSDDLASGAPAQIVDGQLYIINDCINGVVVRASQDGNGVLTYTNSILNDFVYKPHIVVNPFQPAIFYVGAFTPANASVNTPPIPTLYRRTIQRALNGNSFTVTDVPLITGVENLRIEYGVYGLDPSGNPLSHIVNYYTINQLPAAYLDGNGNLINRTVSVVKVTVMIQSAGKPNSAKQGSLFFPDLNGLPVDCYAGGTPDPYACPTFVTSGVGAAKSHKVISYSYTLPRVERLSKLDPNRNNP